MQYSYSFPSSLLSPLFFLPLFLSLCFPPVSLSNFSLFCPVSSFPSHPFSFFFIPSPFPTFVPIFLTSIPIISVIPFCLFAHFLSHFVEGAGVSRVHVVCVQAYPSAFQPTLLAAALPAPGSAAASLLSLAGGGGVAAAPTRLALAAAAGGHQPQQVAASSPSAWSGGGAAAAAGGGQNAPCSTLFVANLGHSCTEAQLTELFQRSVPRFTYTQRELCMG